MMRAGHTALFGRTALAVFAAAAFAAGALVMPATAVASGESDAAAKFIRSFTDEAIVKLTDDDRSASEKVADFRELLVRGFYLGGIGRFVIGRQWRRMDAQQQDEYLNAFEDYLVATYSRRMDAYSGETLDVVGARQRKKDFVVGSLLRGDRNGDLRIDWRVRRMEDGNWKIVDIVIEGISMVVTQRSEFAAVLSDSNGDRTPLLDGLREKWSDFKESESEKLATN